MACVDVHSSPAAPPIEHVQVKDEAEHDAKRQHARFYFLDSYRREKFRNYRPGDASSNHLAAPAVDPQRQKFMKCSRLASSVLNEGIPNPKTFT